MSTSVPAGPVEKTADEIVERLLGATIGMFDILSVYIGDRLGLYRALHDGGPATAAELAARAGIDERYAREWLEQQAVTAMTGTAMRPATLRAYAEEAGFGGFVQLDEPTLDFLRFYLLVP